MNYASADYIIRNICPSFEDGKWTLVYRAHKGMPFHLHGREVPQHGVWCLPESKVYFMHSDYVPLFKLLVEYDIHTPIEALPSIWDTWYYKSPETGNYQLGYSYVATIDYKREEHTPADAREARNWIICKHFYKHRNEGMSEQGAISATAKYFRGNTPEMRRFITRVPLHLKDKLRGPDTPAAPTQKEKKLMMDIAKTKRTDNYTEFTRMVMRARVRAHSEFTRTGNPLYKSDFKNIDCLVDGKLPEMCPVLGIPLDYSGPDKDYADDADVYVWRMDTSKGMTAGNVTCMSKLAAMMIEGARYNRASLEEQMTLNNAWPAWEEYNKTHTTRYKPRPAPEPKRKKKASTPTTPTPPTPGPAAPKHNPFPLNVNVPTTPETDNTDAELEGWINYK